MSFLSKLPARDLFSTVTRTQKLKSTLTSTNLLEDEFGGHLKEYSIFMLTKINFNQVNYPLYEAFFRTFCQNPDCE